LDTGIYDTLKKCEIRVICQPFYGNSLKLYPISHLLQL
jgi:hypothetical protein